MNNIVDFREFIINAVRKVFEQAKANGIDLAPVAFLVRKQDTTVVPIAKFMQNDHTKDMLMQAPGTSPRSKRSSASRWSTKRWSPTRHRHQNKPIDAKWP